MPDQVLIVIPVYNAERYLADTIRSVQQQGHSAWQLVLVDDGSQDSSREIAEQFAGEDDRISLVRQANAGVARARNRAFEFLTQNRYVLFLDNDDLLERDALSRLIRVLEGEPGAVAAHGLARDFEGEEPGSDAATDVPRLRRWAVSGLRLRTLEPDEPTTFESLTIWPCIVTPGQVLIRASALAAAGPFDAETVPADDWDMWLRLTTRGPIAFTSEVTLHKRSHAENVSKNGKVMSRSEPVLRAKLATAPAFAGEHRRAARTGHLWSCYVKAAWAGDHLHRGQYGEAVKTVGRAVKSWVRYVGTRYHMADSPAAAPPRRA